MSAGRTRYLGYGGLGCLLLAVVVFGVATTETRYENVVHRTKGVVIGKEIRTQHRGRPDHIITYRVVVGGRTLEREGSAGSREVWDTIRVGDDIDVESVGDTVYEIRLAIERTASSRVYYGIAAAFVVGGIVLLGLRMRR